MPITRLASNWEANSTTKSVDNAHDWYSSHLVMKVYEGLRSWGWGPRVQEFSVRDRGVWVLRSWGPANRTRHNEEPSTMLCFHDLILLQELIKSRLWMLSREGTYCLPIKSRYLSKFASFAEFANEKEILSNDCQAICLLEQKVE